MSATKNGIRRLPTRPLTPRTSQGEEFAVEPKGYVGKKPPIAEVVWLKTLLAGERRRHAAVETSLQMLIAHQGENLTDLRQQVSDLRAAAISNLAAQMRQQ